MNEEYWSFNRIGEEYWSHEQFETKEEAKEHGQIFAKEKGWDRFVVGRLESVPFSTDPDLEDLFWSLDERYIYDCGDEDENCRPFYDSQTEENKAAHERLSKKISTAVKEYVDEVNLKGNYFQLAYVETIIVKEKGEL